MLPGTGVEGRDQLGQSRHLDASGHHRTDGATEDDGEGDEPEPEERHALVHERRRGGDAHADHAVQVALARGGGVRQTAQRQDEQDRGDEVGEGREGGRHPYLRPPALAPLLAWNMDNMRCVTKKPPNMFTEASSVPMKPKAIAQGESANPVANMAPTTTPRW